MANPRGTSEYEASLRRLSFADNFQSFEIEVTIPAGTEIAIRNEFRNGRVPSKWIVVDNLASGVIRRGDTTWDANYLYLAVDGADDGNAVILFLA